MVVGGAHLFPLVLKVDTKVKENKIHAFFLVLMRLKIKFKWEIKECDFIGERDKLFNDICAFKY